MWLRRSRHPALVSLKEFLVRDAALAGTEIQRDLVGQGAGVRVMGEENDLRTADNIGRCGRNLRLCVRAAAWLGMPSFLMFVRTRAGSMSCSGRLRLLVCRCGGIRLICGRVKTGARRSAARSPTMPWYSSPAFPRRAVPVA